MTLRHLRNRLFALVRKRRLDEELESEILAHLELGERDAIASGLPPEEARRVARLQFGGLDQVRELHRERRSVAWIDALLRDARYAVTMLWRDRTFTAVCVSVLALGIGANAAMFSLVDAVLLKPLPFPQAERIVRVWEAPRPGVTNSTSTLDFLDWKRLGTSFEAWSAETGLSAALTGRGEPQRLNGKAVTAGYFRVFGTRAARGRTFSPDEDQPGAAPVIVLSHAAWQTYFGGEADVLNRRPILDGVAHHVIGVLPPGAFDRQGTEFWKPLVFTPDQLVRDYHWLTVHGRLREDTALEEARAQLAAIEASLESLSPAYKRPWTVVAEPLGSLLVGNGLRRAITVLFGAAAFVLLIACANVANLLLARGAVRRTELAVRAALGAGRGRLLVQLLTETVMLCAAGAAAGLAVAWVLMGVVTSLLGPMVPYTAELTLDHRVLAFAAAVALGVTLVIGVAPALRIDVVELSRTLHRSTPRSSAAHGRLRRFIAVGEVALSLVLVCAALLLFKSLLKIEQLDTGVRIENVVTMSADLSIHAYPTAESAARFYETVAEQIETVPGVLHAGLASHLPLEWIDNGEALEVPGIDELVNIRFKRVNPGYFAALDIPVLAGRGIGVRDRHGAAPVAVINEALAARLADLSDVRNPVGRTVRLHNPHYTAKDAFVADVEIVGIIRSERVGTSPGRPDPPVAYVPLTQVPRPDIKLVIRTDGELTTVLAGIRDAVRRVDRNLPLGDVATMRQVRERRLAASSQPAWLIGSFGAIASLLAALGLYGVLSYTVTQRRRELGIRMALGAKPTDVLSLVLKSGLRMTGLGLVLGLAGAVALTRVLENLLFDVSALDPAALALASMATLIMGLLAGFVPAARAARLAPVEILRDA